MPDNITNTNDTTRDVAKHASRLPEYRAPFGARPTDSHTELFFDVPSDAQNVTLCYTYGLYSFSYHEEPMYRVASSRRYCVKLLMPHETGLLFYWFKYKDSEGKTVFYVADADTKDGEGRVSEGPPHVGADEDKYPYAFQITIYDKNFRTPNAMKGAMIYQIFPDRFRRGPGYSYDRMISNNSRGERIFHEDWFEDVDIYGKPETGYLACDFYGGTLSGITEKLDYIKSLGINVLYLNPIFEARSSHRYDTADYLNVDPILGGNEAFLTLASEAKKRGIRIILDGVFSHTGADSKYFNKFDRYEGIGAYRAFETNDESPCRSWYNLYKTENGDTAYDCWWGFPDLPNVNEDDLSYRNFIFGEGGVVDTWTSRGACGIRLDVSDELPDGFIRQMRDTLKDKTDGEGILVGEVWEDASNKCSYGAYRDFLFGNTHDSVMGYTFRKVVLDFLCGYISASVFDSRLEGFRERYPAEAYYAIMNLVSSHDVPRIFTLLAKPDESDDREEQKKIKVAPADYDKCAALARMAYAFQLAYIGAATLYYGDEVLMEGYKDPFNRRTYPWEKMSAKQSEHLKFVTRLSRLRTDNTALVTGFYKTLLATENVLACQRSLKEGRDFFGNEGIGAAKIVFIMNRSDTPAYIKLENTPSGTTATMLDKSPVPLTNSFVTGPTDSVSLKPNSFIFVIY